MPQSTEDDDRDRRRTAVERELRRRRDTAAPDLTDLVGEEQRRAREMREDDADREPEDGAER